MKSVHGLHYPVARYLIVAALIISFLSFESCSLIKGNKYQTVPVTSRPSGAKIVVDGEEAGSTPLNLKLDKLKDHVVKIEKEGYQPAIITVNSKEKPKEKAFANAFFAPAIIIGSALIGMGIGALVTGGYNDEDDSYIQDMAIAGLLGMIPGAIYVMSQFTSARKGVELSPGRLYVLLEPASGHSEAKIITLTPEEFEQLQWIRLSFVGGGEEEISLK